MPSEVVNSVAKSPRASAIDIDQAFLLWLKLRNFHAVGRELGCSAENIRRRLRKYRSFQAALGQVEQFRQNRADIFTAGELVAFRSLVDDVAIKKAPLAARATTFGIINERRRLEEGKSTTNVLHGAILKIQQDALAQTMKAISSPADGVETTDKPQTKKSKR